MGYRGPPVAGSAAQPTNVILRVGSGDVLASFMLLMCALQFDLMVSSHFFRPHEFNFFLLLAIVFLVISFASAFFVKRSKHVFGESKLRLAHLGNDGDGGSSGADNTSKADDAVGLSLNHIGGGGSSSDGGNAAYAAVADNDDDDDDDELLLGSNSSGCPEVPDLQEPELDVWGLQLLKKVDFWLLFVSMAIEDGAAVFFANSLSSMRGSLEAVGDAEHLPKVGTLVIIFALSNAIGRFTWGT